MTGVGDASYGAVESLPYSAAPAALRRDIARVQARAYGADAPDDAAGDGPPLHDPALNARSFFIRAAGHVVSYAGVVAKTIEHAGQRFALAGLSCVATDPDWQRRGLGRRVVAAATEHMARSCVDIGAFTCAPHLAQFYAEAGDWPLAADVVLIGSRDAGALTSASLGVVVLLRLFSDAARAASAEVLHGTLNLDLPPGQFL